MAEGFHGMSALIEDLRRMPTAIEAEASHHVHDAADIMVAELNNEYAEVTGHLKRGIRTTRVNAFRAIVRSTARHAVIYERGTAMRMHASGKSVGAMPKANVFIPAAIKSRRQMTERIVDVVERQQVRGMTGRLTVRETSGD